MIHPFPRHKWKLQVKRKLSKLQGGVLSLSVREWLVHGTIIASGTCWRFFGQHFWEATRPLAQRCGHLRLCFYAQSDKLQVTSIFSERELKFRFAVCRRPSVCRLSVVCDVRARCALLRRLKFSAMFYAIWYLGHPWPLCKKFTEIVTREPLRRGVKPKRGSKI